MAKTKDIDPRVIQNYLIEKGQLEYAEHFMLFVEETSQLREELEAAKKEIERVKGLVTHAWDQATINCEVENGVYESDDEFKYVSLKDFKSTNNI